MNIQIYIKGSTFIPIVAAFHIAKKEKIKNKKKKRKKQLTHILI